MGLYIDLPGVSMNPAKLPQSLRELLPLARKWCFTDDKDTSRWLKRCSLEEIEVFVRTCESKQDELEKFCFDVDHGVPVPDEAVLMQIMHRNFMEARSEMWLRHSQRK